MTKHLTALLNQAMARHKADLALVSSDGRSLTYEQLDRRSEQLAAYLQGSLSIEPGQKIGVLMSRSPDMVVAMVGILRAGCAFAPIDPNYPQDRVERILQMVTAPALVTDRKTRHRASQFEGIVVTLEDSQSFEGRLVPPPMNEQDVAYTIFTSGSTGQPKGVLTPHRGIFSYIKSMQDSHGYGPNHRFLANASISFDMAIFELMVPLASGSSVVISRAEETTSGQKLKNLLERYDVNVCMTTPSTWRLILEAGWQGHNEFEIIAAGEALPKDLAQKLLPRGQSLWNMYGPTETTVVSVLGEIRANDQQITIGRATTDTELYLLDQNQNPVPDGETGELYVGGPQIALGYLGASEHDQRRFTKNFINPESPYLLYRTSDLCYQGHDGRYYYQGRIDHQVKIRGYRIELTEVESVLAQHPEIHRCHIVVNDDQHAGKRLVAYYQPKAEKCPTYLDLREFVKESLPDYMIPTHFMAVDHFPQTNNGKLDQDALPPPLQARTSMGAPYTPPMTQGETKMADVVGGVLGFDKIGVEDHLFDIGMNSLTAVVVSQQLQQQGFDIAPHVIFDQPTIRKLAASSRASFSNEDNQAPHEPSTSRDIAIIGLSCRFPGCNDAQSYWDHLLEGHETIRTFTMDELEKAGIRDHTEPNYIPRRGIIDGADEFDASFFAMPPKEATITDPQIRLFLQETWRTLEDGGYGKANLNGTVGVFAGMHRSTYFQKILQEAPEVLDSVSDFARMIASEKDYIATQVSHKLNLRGPSISVNTGCSTSLVAVIQAMESIRQGSCDMALAGGVSIHAPIHSGYQYQEGQILAKDGHCRPFDQDGSGTIFSDGVGVVLLKSLDQALADRDHIYGVLKGGAINNDGGEKASFSAPSITGQRDCLMAAQQDARISRSEVQYIEAHGTGTIIGDPIETAAIKQAYEGPLSIGSVKGNLGHTVTAAGIAGLIKTCLMLKHKTLVPSINVNSINPACGFDDFLKLQTEVTPIAHPSPFMAGVSSFGVGGTNAHVILAEAPTRQSQPRSDRIEVLPLSAKKPEVLGTLTANMGQFLERSQANLADIAFTLQEGRESFPYRSYLIARGNNILKTAKEIKVSPPTKGLAFIFPGQGSQHQAMAQELWDSEPAFKEALGQCHDLLMEHHGIDLLYELANASQARLEQTWLAQVAIFSVEYALAKLWESFDIKPNILIGHSVGEFACAVISGVLTLEEAIDLVAIRASLMWKCPEGVMLSIRAPQETVERLLPPRISIAAINGPKQIAVGGSERDIDAFTLLLQKEGIASRKLKTSHAFHTPAMNQAATAFNRRCQDLASRDVQIPIVSTVTGETFKEGSTIDPTYWGNQIVKPVDFFSAMGHAKTMADYFIEVGPGSSLTSLLRQISPDIKASPSLRSASAENGDRKAFLSAVGELWQHGFTPRWRNHQDKHDLNRVSLPTYPFQKKSFWILPNSHQKKPESQCQSQEIPMAEKSQILEQELKELFENETGFDQQDLVSDESFLEWGLDSLLLTQVAIAISNHFKVQVNFRDLIEDTPDLPSLAERLEKDLSDDYFTGKTADATPSPVQTPAPTVPPAPVPQPPATPLAETTLEPFQVAQPANPTQAPMITFEATPSPASDVEATIQMQLKIMASQLDILRGRRSTTAPLHTEQTPTPAPQPKPSQSVKPAPQQKSAQSSPATNQKGEGQSTTQKAFGAIAKISKKNEGMTPQCQAYFDEFVTKYEAKTKASKTYTQQYRRCHADPRAVTGFKPALKELVYPLVMNKSQGAYLWDLDGHKYVDLTCGFGSNFFGNSPTWLKERLGNQVEQGFEIGPQHELAGIVAEKVSQYIGHDRVAFCNTGSEAVLGALRIARTTTGRKKIVSFSGSYHGINDEVIVRGSPSGRSLPAAPGIMPNGLENTTVLDYGTDESLDFIRQHASQLAAILVEPVQSRRPDFRPKEFLQKLREICDQEGCVLIFDEIITGFRYGRYGAQGYYGIKADLATYGKVIGGGMPIGLIAGKSYLMDRLDGGPWAFGDQSLPEIGVTYFAGTFVRHPMSLAAMDAVMDFLNEAPATLQEDMNRTADIYVTKMNALFKKYDAPLQYVNFGSLMKLNATQDVANIELLYYILRFKGLHTYDGFPNFFTIAHSQADIDFISDQFEAALKELSEIELWGPVAKEAEGTRIEAIKLGRDQNGEPATFFEDPDNPGQYIVAHN